MTPSWPSCASCSPSWLHLGCKLAILAPSWLQLGPSWRQYGLQKDPIFESFGHPGASWNSFWRSWAPSWLQGSPQAPPIASRPPQTSISTDLGTIFGRIWGPQDAQVAAKMASWTSIWTPQGCRITKKSTYKKISFDPTNTRGRRQRRQPLNIF